ncbi:4-hydroxythreonine-4-phosphate dehydrogenase PdxA [Candidatus Pelagibacter sp.]|uniref:4-hydroxythreonine-4-phosphate dehydrogenase PdxA n=1 Tax=Candidatus Pelagibacter sp. TaxID=2024849 RepID=UPI003F842308
MHPKPILIVPGQIKSIFFEILFKSFKNKKFLSPLILICSIKIFKENAKKFNFKGQFKTINSKFDKLNLNNQYVYIIDVKSKKDKIKTKFDNEYLSNCFDVAFSVLKNKYTHKFLNGPINKKNFLNKKYRGITEYISERFNKKNYGMLIYNKELSVCPLTTHLPLKLVSKQISKKSIQEKIKLINIFYLKNFKLKPRIAVTGLNPHCESILSFNEDEKIVASAIKDSKKNKILVNGPFPADTIFLKQNRKKYDVILGMYHDQVLTPLKTLFEYDAINITMGLPFLRVSPDHGPNEKMVGKNLSNPTSLIRALEFLDKN